MRRMFPILALSLAASVWGFGCTANECTKMIECCQAIKGQPGVGKWCGEFSMQTRDPDTGRSIVDTVQGMYQSRKEEVPPVCR